MSRDYGISPRWVYELGRRFDAEGETGLEAPSRRPRTSPKRTPVEIEGEIELEFAWTACRGDRRKTYTSGDATPVPEGRSRTYGDRLHSDPVRSLVPAKA